MNQTNFDEVLDEFPATRLKGKRLWLAQTIWKLRQVVPSPEAKAAGRRRLLAAVERKRQSRQA